MGMVTPSNERWADLGCGGAGRSGIGPITRFDASSMPVTFAAEAEEVPAHPSDEGDLKLRLALTALEQAVLAQSDPVPGERTGVCMGSEIDGRHSHRSRKA